MLVLLYFYVTSLTTSSKLLASLLCSESLFYKFIARHGESTQISINIISAFTITVIEAVFIFKNVGNNIISRKPRISHYVIYMQNANFLCEGHFYPSNQRGVSVKLSVNVRQISLQHLDISHHAISIISLFSKYKMPYGIYCSEWVKEATMHTCFKKTL